jgi:hypothetical protein
MSSSGDAISHPRRTVGASLYAIPDVIALATALRGVLEAESKVRGDLYWKTESG